MAIPPIVSKAPKLLKTAYDTYAEREEMATLMCGALARAICPADRHNPYVVELAEKVNGRLWAPGKARPEPLGARIMRRVRRFLRKADPEVIDWLRWREEMKGWVGDEISSGELDHALLLADCKTDGPADREAFLASVPQMFLDELNSNPTPLSLQLLHRARTADEERRRYVFEQAAARYGPQAAAAAIGAKGGWELAHLIDLNSFGQTTMTLAAALALAQATAKAIHAQRRSTLRRLVPDWAEATRRALHEGPEERQAVLADLRARLVIRAMRLDDDELVHAFENVEDALIRFEADSSAHDDVLRGLDGVANLLEAPLRPRVPL